MGVSAKLLHTNSRDPIRAEPLGESCGRPCMVHPQTAGPSRTVVDSCQHRPWVRQPACYAAERLARSLTGHGPTAPPESTVVEAIIGFLGAFRRSRHRSRPSRLSSSPQAGVEASERSPHDGRCGPSRPVRSAARSCVVGFHPRGGHDGEPSAAAGLRLFDSAARHPDPARPRWAACVHALRRDLHRHSCGPQRGSRGGHDHLDLPLPSHHRRGAWGLAAIS